MQGVDKYDRQLRLWGAFGQQRLMKSHILLIHADAAGCETLKNLILPGVGAVTVWDDKEVTHGDASSNFFTPVTTIGRPRAEVALEYLCALNPEVQGSFQHVTSLLSFDVSALTSFSLIVLSNATPQVITAYSSACKQYHIPLLVLRSRGFYGSVHLQVQEHDVLDTKPDAAPLDLRINQPFPALQAYIDQFDLSSQSSIDHFHTPFIVILAQLFASWKAQHGVPSTFQQKEAFKKYITSHARDVSKADNYAEAAKFAYLAYQPSDFALEELREVIAAFADKTLSSSSCHFQFLIRALSEYMQQHNTVPLMGTVPDMTASTDAYVTLQQAAEDKREFESLLQSLLVANAISDDVISMFCKNVRQLRLVTSSSIASAYDDKHLAVKLGESCDDDEDGDPLQTPRYALVSLLCAEKYALVNGEAPVSSEALYSFCLENISDSLRPSRDQCEEICRYGSLELHNISSVLGGVASQEAVKLLTHQYVPINNAFVFNGIAGVAAVYEI